MSRVALVTGGTRGIGEAISKALKQAGYKVAANYAGNDQVAQKFKAATGIAVYKWDVSSFESCAAAKRVVAKFLRDLPYAFRDNNSQAVAKEEGEVHRALPPYQRRAARRCVLRTQGGRSTRRGPADLGGLRGRTRAKPRGFARSGPARSISGTAEWPASQRLSGWAYAFGIRGAARRIVGLRRPAGIHLGARLARWRSRHVGQSLYKSSRAKGKMEKKFNQFFKGLTPHLFSAKM
jgi:NAD(P)-dependent dehydrogenase (short-subunit alcohol dehydrogenase family)